MLGNNWEGYKCKIFALIGILLSLLLGWLVYTHGPLATARVQITSVQLADLQPQIFGIGTVEARSLYTVGPTQAGRLADIYVNQGDKVMAGQMIAEMEPVDLEGKVSSVMAANQRAKSMAAVAEMQMREAQSKRDLAQIKLERYQKLFSENAISREILDEFENNQKVTQAAFAAATFSVQAAQLAIEVAAADYQATLKQRANLKIISPVNGIVVSRDMEAGNTVVAGQSVVKITDMDAIWVKTRIDQMRANCIVVGQRVDIVVRSMPNKILKGTVARLDIQGDSVTEERTVNIAFESSSTGLLLGDIAEVTIALSPVSNAIHIPIGAVKKLNRQTGVWIVKEGKAIFKPVELGVSNLEGETQIVKGLQENDKVIIVSPVDLKEGMKVRVEDRL